MLGRCELAVYHRKLEFWNIKINYKQIMDFFCGCVVGLQRQQVGSGCWFYTFRWVFGVTAKSSSGVTALCNRILGSSPTTPLLIQLPVNASPEMHQNAALALEFLWSPGRHFDFLTSTFNSFPVLAVVRIWALKQCMEAHTPSVTL